MTAVLRIRESLRRALRGQQRRQVFAWREACIEGAQRVAIDAGARRLRSLAATQQAGTFRRKRRAPRLD
jgi:hypothetical protein